MFSTTNNLHKFEHDGFIFKLDYCEPSKYAQDVARKELRETPENVQNGLTELRRLLKEASNLNCPLDNDLWLMSFLRPAHYYPESALQMIRNYFNCRQKYPQLFKDLTLETVKKVQHDYVGSTLPQRDQNGRRMFVALSGKYWDLQKFDKELLMKSFILETEYLRSEPDTQICGIVLILDMLDVSLRKVLLLTPNYLKCVADFIQEGMAIRFKGYHVVNQPKFFDIAFAVIKPFLQDKFAKRVHFHGKDRSSLHQHISPDYLPECYGGTMKSAQPSYGPQFYELFARYESDYERFRQYGYK